MMRSCRCSAILLLAGAVAGAGCAEDVEREEIGSNGQRVTEVAPEVPVSPPGQGAQNVSAAWIKSAQISTGHALLGYTQDNVAAWAHSFDWSLSAPTWEAHRADDPAPYGWPEPENFCDVYACDAGAQWGLYSSTAQVVWTGLDDVALAVAIGGPLMQPTADLVLLSSTDGGETFTRAHILSIATPDGDSGGSISVNTAHASLMYAPERTNTQAGTEALPIYIVWRNQALDAQAWWMAKAIVGTDGTIAPMTLPTPVSAIAPSAAAHASILGFVDDVSTEWIALTWSERTNAAGAPSPGPACPSNDLLHVKWFSEVTRDFGANWYCGPAHGQPPADCLMAEDSAWRPCVGQSSAELAGSALNNDRPEMAMTRGKYRWVAAINRSVAGQAGTRVRLMRQRSTGWWEQAYTSPSTDPTTGADLGDSWGQALAVVQGSSSSHSIFCAVWRNANLKGTISMNAACSTSSADDGTFTTTGLTGGPDVPWPAPDGMGLHSGVAALQICMDEPCSGGEPAESPKIPFFGGWPDGRISATSQIWAKAFLP